MLNFLKIFILLLTMSLSISEAQNQQISDCDILKKIKDSNSRVLTKEENRTLGACDRKKRENELNKALNNGPADMLMKKDPLMRIEKKI